MNASCLFRLEGAELFSGAVRECVEHGNFGHAVDAMPSSVGARLIASLDCKPPDVQAFGLAERAIEFALGGGERIVNTGHLAIAAADQGVMGGFDAAAMQSHLQKMRKSEIMVRAFDARTTRSPILNSPPTELIQRYYIELDEAEALLTFLDSARNGESVGTWDILRAQVLRFPNRWDWFLRPFGISIPNATTTNRQESGLVWVLGKAHPGQCWIEFSPTEVDRGIPVSLPCAETIWRTLGIAGTHGMPWYPDLLLATSLAIPGTATHETLSPGRPRDLDMAWAGFASFGHDFEGESEVMGTPIDILGLDGHEVSFEPRCAETDGWVVERELEAAVYAALGGSNATPRASSVRSPGSSEPENEVILGARFAIELLGGDLNRAGRSARAMSRLLHAQLRQRDGDTVRSIAHAIGTSEAEDRSPLDSAHDLQEAQIVISELFDSATFGDVFNRFVERPWLLSPAWDDLFNDRIAATDKRLIDEASGNAWDSGSIVGTFRYNARLFGAPKIRAWIGSQTEEVLFVRFGIADRSEEEIRSALESWQASPGDPDLARELLRLLKLGALVGPPNQAPIHALLGAKTAMMLTETQLDEFKDVASEFVGLAWTLGLPGQVHLAAVASVEARLAKLKHQRSPRPEFVKEAVRAVAKGIAAMPGIRLTVGLVGELAEISLWKNGPGEAGAKFCLELYDKLKDLEPGSESAAAEQARTVILSRDNPIVAARARLASALERCSAENRDAATDRDVITWRVNVGRMSDDETEIRQALDAAQHLIDRDRTWSEAILLHRVTEKTESDLERLRATADRAWGLGYADRELGALLKLAEISLEIALRDEGTAALVRVRQNVVDLAADRLITAIDDRERVEISNALNGLLSKIAEAFDSKGDHLGAVVCLEAGSGIVLWGWREPNPRTVSQIEQDLAFVSEEYTVVYLSSNESSTTAYLVKSGLRVDRVVLGFSREDLLEHTLDVLLDDQSNAPLTEVAESAHRLGQWLWPKVVRPLLGHGFVLHHKACFVMKGAFHLVPLQLAWESSSKFPDGRRYLADICTPAFCPSIGMQAESLRNAGPIKLRRIVAVAPKGSGIFPELPFSVREVDEIAEHFPDSDVLKGTNATYDQMAKALESRHDVFHFAGHGLTRIETGVQMLILSENQGYPISNIRHAKRHEHRLAVASACQTAVFDPKKPNESISVATSLFAAGYAGSIGSSWSVSDLAMTLLFSRFYRLLRDDDDPCVRLRDAQFWLRTSTSNAIRAEFPWANFALKGGTERPFENPIFWAAPVYYGV